MVKREAGFASLTELVNGTMPDIWYRNLLIDGVIASLGGIFTLLHKSKVENKVACLEIFQVT